MHTKDVHDFYDLCRKNKKVGNEVVNAVKNYDMDKTERNLKRILEKITSIAQKNGYDIKESDILEYVKERKKNLSVEELKMVSGGASKALSTMAAAVTFFSSVVPNQRAFASDTDVDATDFYRVDFGSYSDILGEGSSLSSPNEEKEEKAEGAEGAEGVEGVEKVEEEEEENEHEKLVVDAMSSLGMARESKESYIQKVFELLSDEEIDEDTDIASLLKSKIVGDMELFISFLRMNEDSQNKDFVFNVTGGNLNGDFEKLLFETFFTSFFESFERDPDSLISNEGVMFFSRIYDVKKLNKSVYLGELVLRYLSAILQKGGINKRILLDLIKMVPSILDDIPKEGVEGIIEFLAGSMKDKSTWLANNPAFFKYFVENDEETATCAVANILKTNALENKRKMYPNLINVIDPVLTKVVRESMPEDLLNWEMGCPALLRYIIEIRGDLAHDAILKALTQRGSNVFENFVLKNHDLFDAVCEILNEIFNASAPSEKELLDWARRSSTFLEYVIENQSEEVVIKFVKELGEDSTILLEKNIEKNKNLAEKIGPVIMKIVEGYSEEELRQLLVNNPLFLRYMVDINQGELVSSIVKECLEGEQTEKFKGIIFRNPKIFERLFPLMCEKKILPQDILKEFFQKNEANFMKCAGNIPDMFGALLGSDRGSVDTYIQSLLEKGGLKNWIIENPDLLKILWDAYGEYISETLGEIFMDDGFTKWVMDNPKLLVTLNEISEGLPQAIGRIKETPNWFSWLYSDSGIIELLLHLGTQDCTGLVDDFFQSLLSDVSKTQEWVCHNPDMFTILEKKYPPMNLIAAIDGMYEGDIINLICLNPKVSEFCMLNCESVVTRMINKLSVTDLQKWAYSDRNILFKLERHGSIKAKRVFEGFVEAAHDIEWIMENFDLYIVLMYLRPELLKEREEGQIVEAVETLLGSTENIDAICNWFRKNYWLLTVSVRAKADFINKYIGILLEKEEFIELIAVRHNLFSELMKSDLAGGVAAKFLEYIMSDGEILKTWVQNYPDNLAALIPNLEDAQVDEFIGLIRENLDEDEDFNEFMHENPQVFIALNEKGAGSAGEFIQYLLEKDEQLKRFLIDSPEMFDFLLSKGRSAHIEKFIELLSDEERIKWIWDNPKIFLKLRQNYPSLTTDFIKLIIEREKIKDWAYNYPKLFAYVLENLDSSTPAGDFLDSCGFTSEEVEILGYRSGGSVFCALYRRTGGTVVVNEMIDKLSVDDFAALLQNYKFRPNWEWLVMGHLEKVRAAIDSMYESGTIFGYIDANLDILPLVVLLNVEIATEYTEYIGQKDDFLNPEEAVEKAIGICKSLGSAGDIRLWEFCRQLVKSL